MSKSAKQVRVFMSRKITLQRHGKEDVVLQQGANTVDADVADHEFVKAHTVAEATEQVQAADKAAQARIAELEKQVAELTTKNDEQAAMLAAYEAAAKADAKK